MALDILFIFWRELLLGRELLVILWELPLLPFLYFILYYPIFCTNTLTELVGVAANVIVTFKDSGSISDTLKLDTPDKSGKVLAKGNGFYVSFKTGGGGSKPYLALRSKKLSKKDIVEEITFKDILFEELENEGVVLTEEHIQLDEFALFSKLKGKAIAIGKNISSKISRVVNAITKRLKEAFSFIKSLGSKMLSGLLKFLGFQPNVRVSGGGRFPLRWLVLHN